MTELELIDNMEIKEKKNSKILIVDDQQKNIQVLGSLLRQKNYIIGVAMNGQQALKALIESDDYDLVLLDVNMPIMDGFETCKAIREQDNLKEIPIIFLTALVDTENIVNAFKIGGQDYLTKPFNSKELLARVNTHLELKHSRDKLKQVNTWLENKVAERTLELKIAKDKLLHLDAAKSEFLNIISHEMKTPLNGIIGILPTLNRFQLPSEVNEMLEILKTSAKRLENFSYKALDISLFNTKGKNTLSLCSVNPNELIVSNIIKYQENAEQKNITITHASEPNVTISLLDPSFMNKCFSYIIDNALKFGNIDSQVTIQTAIQNESFVVSIENEGIPFPENFSISSIQPFNTKTHVNKNPGLSLFLCKQIIEAHNGQIEIMNTQKGAIVKLILPKIDTV
ncbi:hybrid sensor histidine kinase/response regulator [Reichenbachiella sp. MALMAid0571]|uniref:hybrid sensor histidine kinase/response regulator n=1 Tax=Reichenbachiella sp. MALMAid0571 TaxID=3143939 RepID=UPI0032E03AD0